MIIVFFHVLYLLGKFIYRNYREGDSCGDDGEDNNGKIEGPTCGGVEVNRLEKEGGGSTDFYDDFYGEDESETVRFSPPAYIQRYHAVASLLADEEFQGQIRKVVDFGCSELGFFQHLKNTRGIEEILCVDVDKDTLEKYKERVEPFTSDYLVWRDAPLNVHVLEGSVTDSDQYLDNTDAVICIELIEHLYPETCINLPHNIFGFIQPKIAVFTTPNADFNVLFKRMTGFRHWDHKFEWTRQQFQDWANNVVTRYPNYQVDFQGIGKGPPGSEDVGDCSQMATFTRKGARAVAAGAPGLFKLITTVEYPYRIDNRTIEEKTLQEAIYYIRHYSLNNEDEAMPLDLLAKWIDTVSASTLRDILENEGWQIVNHGEKGLSVLCPPQSEYSEFDENDDYDNEMYLNQWNDESSGHYQEVWPEIHDQDEEMWENEEENYEDNSSTPSPLHHFNDINDAGYSKAARGSSGDSHRQIPQGNRNFSLLPADCGGESTSQPRGLSGVSVKTEDHISDNSGGENGGSRSNSGKNWVGGEVTHSRDLLVSSADRGHDDSRTLDSICSYYLQPSLCSNDQTFPEDITNPDFQPVNDDGGDVDDGSGVGRGQQYSPTSNHSPKVTSTPVKSKGKSRRSEECSQVTEIFDKCREKILINEDFQGLDEHESFMSISDSCSSCQKEKIEVMRKLKGSASMASLKKNGGSRKNTSPNEDKNGQSEVINPVQLSSYHDSNSIIFDTNNKSLKSKLMTKRPSSLSTSDQHHQQLDKQNEEMKNLVLSGSSEILDAITEILRKEPDLKEIDDKGLSEARASSPCNSWSPEIMDSGYPNTSSAHDITPEGDLSSIGQDKISSESQSPSLAEPPRQLEAIVGNVENGDLANNNRDGEGNNVIPVGDNNLDDLQPLINVLENDLENENDIYDFQNAFPMWLLRIFDAGGAALHGDEGFDSSDDDDREEVDENENIDEL